MAGNYVFDDRLRRLYASDNSFGFRPGRSTHDAIRRCRQFAIEGYVYEVSMDMQAYFDTVNHSKLIEVLSRTIKDGRVISLTHKYLNAGVMEDGGFHPTEEDVPFITGKLFLKVNLQKTTVCHISKVKCLGYGFYRYRGKYRFRVHPKSVEKFKKKLRMLSTRGNKRSNPVREKKLNDAVRGWINHFRYADMKKLI